MIRKQQISLRIAKVSLLMQVMQVQLASKGKNSNQLIYMYFSNLLSEFFSKQPKHLSEKSSLPSPVCPDPHTIGPKEVT